MLPRWRSWPRVKPNRWIILLGCLALLGCSSRIEKAIAQADELRGTQRYEEALAAYAQVIALYDDHPRCAEVLLRMGDLYQFNLEHPQAARRYYRQLVRQWSWQPAALSAYLRLADLAEAQRDFPGAIEALESILRYFPTHPERQQLRHRIGALYLREKNFAQARIEFSVLLEDPTLVPAVRRVTLFDMGEAHLLSGEPEQAISFFTDVVTRFPESPVAGKATDRLAVCHAEMGELGVAAAIRERMGPADAVPAAVVTLTPPNAAPMTVRVEVVDTPEARTRGLMYRQFLPKGSGMWFVFPETGRSPFWMKNTFIALDILFIDHTMQVVDIMANARPLSKRPLKPRTSYRYVLEVEAGFAKQHRIITGTTVKFQGK
jgi:uncharacterized protein